MIHELRWSGSSTPGIYKSHWNRKNQMHTCVTVVLFLAQSKSNAGTIHDLALMLQPLHNLLLAQPVRQIEQNKKGREFWTIL